LLGLDSTMINRMLVAIPFMENETKREDFFRRWKEIDDAINSIHKEIIDLYTDAKKELAKSGRNLDKIGEELKASNK